jgi:hypothetical protein
MEMQFFWVGDKVAQEMYDITWHPGLENLADYQSKHHVGLHHVAVRPYYPIDRGLRTTGVYKNHSLN